MLRIAKQSDPDHTRLAIGAYNGAVLSVLCFWLPLALYIALS